MKILEGESLYLLILKAKERFREALGAVIISREQAITYGRYMDELKKAGRDEELVWVPGDTAMAQNYAIDVRADAAVQAGSTRIAPVAKFSAIKGIPLFLRDVEMPPVLLVKGIGTLVWEPDDNTMPGGEA